MERSQAIKHLSALTKAVAKKDVRSREDWREWFEDDEDGQDRLLDYLDYRQAPGGPKASSLVVPHFHPKLPLIGWNYTKLAHLLLEHYESIWTPVIRQCRGIVFDTSGQLVALPFEKFFNYSTGEHPETKRLTGPFTATEKHDGDLGIIFRYRRRLHVTTRGTFGYQSAKLAETMIAGLDREAWRKHAPAGRTLLVEIIHPETHHLRVYRKSGLVLIGAMDNETCKDFDAGELKDLAAKLGIESAATADFQSVREIEEYMLTPVQNREGYVARWPDGRRAKFKFIQHLGRMYAEALGKNPHAYVMKTLQLGIFEEKVAAMDDEPAHKALDIRRQVLEIVSRHKSYESRMEQLMLLPPLNQRTNSYRDQCREFLKNGV